MPDTQTTQSVRLPSAHAREAALAIATKVPRKRKPRPPRTAPFRRGGERILDRKDVLEALRKADGIRTTAAAALNVSRTTLVAYLDLHPEFQEALDQIHEANGDLAESTLIAAIREKDLRAVTFFLSTRMKNRGYSTRIENTGVGGGPMQHEMAPSPDAMLALLDKMAAQVAPVAPAPVSLPLVAPVPPTAATAASVVDRKLNGRGPAIA